VVRKIAKTLRMSRQTTLSKYLDDPNPNGR
jgi:hypothetical protein